MEFRPIKESDLGSTYDIRFSVTENRILPHQIHLLERDRVLEQLRSGFGVLAIEGDAAVGYCTATGGRHAFINALFVRPAWHGAGVGREMLERALAWLREQGSESVSLVTDPGARADGFYQHLGWIRGELDSYGCQVTFRKSLST
ncbi:GNAT family N-acetyltransferase [Burkholderia pseudomallei]|uniref:GNAT family N-acetyltransferase n=1 Tax=Burkholderia pseudomallei TaxID=28450 RepID=UPI001AAE1A82|nr:GNAT family N-acetyltransferase [Burkholderia pseudomallei]MBO3047974.1 GNAT family N-acetyltransferase [Burkholderia pseudomallei]